MMYMQTIAKQTAHLGPDVLLSCLQSLKGGVVWVWHSLAVSWGLLHPHTPQSDAATTGGSRLPRVCYLLIGTQVLVQAQL